MDIVDYLYGLGVIGIIILYVLVFLILFCAPIIVAIVITNYLGMTGLAWWAFVIVIWMFIVSLLAFLRNVK